MEGNLLRDHFDMIVLSILEKKDSYGYAINKTVMTLTDGAFQFTEATLYTTFKRLQREGFISTYWKKGGPARKGNTTPSPRKDGTISRNVALLGTRPRTISKESWTKTRIEPFFGRPRVTLAVVIFSAVMEKILFRTCLFTFRGYNGKHTRDTKGESPCARGNTSSKTD